MALKKLFKIDYINGNKTELRNIKRMRKSIIIGLGILILGITGCKKEDAIINIQPKHFLSDENFDQLLVEIVAVEGHEPNSDALNNLTDLLNARLNKPQGITFTQRTIESPGNVSYTADDLRSLEEDIRIAYAEDDQLAGYIFYADTEYAENTESSQVLGVAYSSTSMCVFKETIGENSED